MAINFKQPDDLMMGYIGAHMRDEDEAEVWASNRLTPDEAVRKSVEMSSFSVVVCDGEVPLSVLGLAVKRDQITYSGVPWLLSSKAVLKHPREFMRIGPTVINEMLSITPRLYNYVHVDNSMSTRWLKRLGFEFDEPAPFGKAGELFCRFHMMRWKDV